MTRWPLAVKMTWTWMMVSGIFLEKYMADPGYCPEVLADIEEASPAPRDVQAWLNRPVDTEILDLMDRGNGRRWVKESDGAFQSILGSV